jgi:hypothetical protein
MARYPYLGTTIKFFLANDGFGVIDIE